MNNANCIIANDQFANDPVLKASWARFSSSRGDNGAENEKPSMFLLNSNCRPGSVHEIEYKINTFINQTLVLA